MTTTMATEAPTYAVGNEIAGHGVYGMGDGAMDMWLGNHVVLVEHDPGRVRVE